MTEPYYLVFDAETGGVDVFNDRIVQFVMSLADGDGNVLNTREWIINPGVPIPEEASAIHGYTDEFVAEHGRAPAEVLPEIIHEFEMHRDLVIVGYNISFDLSMLVAEIDRHLGDGEAFWATMQDARFFDPLVADRGFDRYRKGKRKLVNVAEHYAIVSSEENYHNALFDVEVTAKVAAAVERKFGLPTVEVQKEMHVAWADSFEQFIRRAQDVADQTERGGQVMPQYRVTMLVEASSLPMAVHNTLWDAHGEPRLDIKEIWAEEESK